MYLMSSTTSYDPTRSTANIESNDEANITPSLDSLAVALTFSQTLRSFAEDAPSKLKWCNLSNTDMKRFDYYDIIEPAEMNMGETTVWTLQNWVHRLFSYTNETFNFSAKQIKTFTDLDSFFCDTDEPFAGSDAPIGNRKLGQLRSLDLLEFEEDNRSYHSTTLWRRTEKVERLVSLKEQL